MNPISALFTFPIKRFPGNPGSRPEPAWSLVPDAIMVNSPFGNIQEMFFFENNKRILYLQTFKIFLQPYSNICKCI